METKTFKKIVSYVLLECGFIKHGSYFHLENVDVLVVIGAQKSNYSHGYYVNIGFVLRELILPGKKVRDVDGDIRMRISYYDNGSRSDFFDLEILREDETEKVKNAIKDYISQNVKDAITKQGLKNLLQEKPVLLNKTTSNAKKILGFQ